VLRHLIGGDATIPPDRGLFLERTFRLHPDVCGYISQEFYEGRLEPAAVAAERTTPFGTGLRYLPVEHEGNRQEAGEEVEVVGREVARLLGAGVPAHEIMVVSPYNVQVNALREALPAAVPVGTVDKFQGQEAQVVLYSMASSSGEDVPRGLEFLLSRNRLNVAISRARCLAYLVCSPRLLEVNCRSIAQMRLANALCRFVEVAEAQARASVSRMELTSLPGHELVLAGLDDLARGVESREALLVSIGAPRLRQAGIDVPRPLPSPEHRLYELLAAEGSDAAHSRYNALVRRLVSFERAADARAR
jgi:hypothetical protein